MVHFLFRAAILWIFLSINGPSTEGSNILLVVTGPRSHKSLFNKIADALAERAHNVTVVRLFERENKHPNVTEIVIPVKDPEKYTDMATKLISHDSENKGIMIMDQLFIFSKFYNTESAKSESLQKFVRSGQKFDLAIVNNVLSDIGLVLAYHLGNPPIIYVNAVKMLPPTFWKFSIPSPISHVPTPLLKATTRMTVVQKLSTLYQNAYWIFWNYYDYFPTLDAVVAKYFPPSPPLRELEGNVTLIFSNSHPVSDYARPMTPNVVEIGGIHLKEPKPLDKEFQEVVDNVSEDGFVLFSLGSIANPAAIPNTSKKNLMAAFARINQTVIMKWGQAMNDTPPNVKIFPWLPQQDLLAQPKCRVFIAHCGMLGIQESLNGGGVPIIAMPWGAEQYGNAVQLEERGMAIYLNNHRFTEEEMYQSLVRLLNDPKYANKAKEISRIFKDRLNTPGELVGYWSEFVIRYGGAKHLLSSAQDMSIFEYFYFDIVFSLLFVALFGILSAVYTFRYFEGTVLTKSIRSKLK